MSRAVTDRFLDLVWPRKCIVCRRILEKEPGMLCPDCRRQLPAPQRGPKRGEHYRRCVSVFSYEGAWRESVLRYKFGGRRVYARVYGPLLAEVVRRELDGKYDVLTYVPLSRKRRRERGCDQAELLAESAAEALGVPVFRLLERVRNAPPQSRISGAAERRANILNSYQAADPSSLAGRRVLLIDDILTSGATLSEASRVLLQAGASSVVCATLALTPRNQPQKAGY